MSSYRIAPDGAEGWKVQSKWLGLFWFTLHREVSYGYWETLSFPTEAEAEAWIDKALDYERRNAEWHQKSRERRSIPPRTYPTP